MSGKVLSDRRVQRSAALLRESFRSLIEERDFADITIRDITDHANLGRATFYLHYQSKDEMLKELIDDLVVELGESMQPTVAEFKDALDNGTAHPDARRPIGIRTLQLLNQRRALYRSLSHSSAALDFWDRVQELYRQRFLGQLRSTGKVPAPGSPPFEYRAIYASGGVRAITRDWLDQETAQPAEAISYFTRYVTMFLVTENVIDPDTAASNGEQPVAPAE